MPDGSLLVVSMRDHRVLRWTPQESATLHAGVSEHGGGHLDDLVVDGTGRAYAGEFGFDLMAGGDPATANLIRIDPDGSASMAADEMLFPNGSVVTPDGQTLIVGETAGARYTAFTPARRIAQRPPCLGPAGARCIRVAPGGEIVDEIAAPEGLDVFACMLGGEDGRTLLMCAAPDFMEHTRRGATDAVLLTTTVDAPHAGLP
jgi:sugar lactone lactonase YvrE